jgi:hypothetical protein
MTDIPRSPANQTWREFMEFEAAIGDDFDEVQRRIHRKRSKPVTKKGTENGLDDRRIAGGAGEDGA